MVDRLEQPSGRRLVAAAGGNRPAAPVLCARAAEWRVPRNRRAGRRFCRGRGRARSAAGDGFGQHRRPATVPSRCRQGCRRTTSTSMPAPSPDLAEGQSQPGPAGRGAVVTARWRAQSGQSVDGVVALDAQALAMILRGSAPIQAGGQQVPPDRLVEYLAIEQYRSGHLPMASDDPGSARCCSARAWTGACRAVRGGRLPGPARQAEDRQARESTARPAPARDTDKERSLKAGGGRGGGGMSRDVLDVRPRQDGAVAVARQAQLSPADRRRRP